MSHYAPSDSRRDFLTKAAALTGAAIFLGSKTYASQRLPVPLAGPRLPLKDGEPIRMGVIGTGGMGTAHCDAILNLAAAGKCNVKIVALADVCKPRVDYARELVEKKQPGITVETYRDYTKLLARDDLHAVLIASPEHWHAQHAIDSIVAGKDVYLEKPMTLNLPDALRLREVVNANPDILFQVGTQYVQYPRFTEAKKLIAEGAIGKPTISQASYCRNSEGGEWHYDQDPKWVPGENLDWEAWCKPLGTVAWNPQIYAAWRRFRTYSTGIIGDLLVHWMTPMCMALDMGWPTRVVASGGHLVDTQMQNHDTVIINAEFEKQHCMLVTGSTCNESSLPVMVRGHKGNMFLGDRHCLIRPEPTFSKEIKERKVECPDVGEPQDRHRLAWFESIRTRTKPLADIELGTKIMVIVDLATRSLWDGKGYLFDPKTMTARPA